MIFTKNLKLKKKSFFVTINIDLERQSKHSELRPYTSSFVIIAVIVQ